ncbi:Phosphoribosylformylglycinamidine synthase [Blattella germanica]|nr:Phosphoribosylformylglycinamidine synthase [Blattella germanica]
MVIIRFYRKPGLSSSGTAVKLRQLRQHTPLVRNLETELCFNIETTSLLSASELEKIRWILGSPLEPQNLTTEPHLTGVFHGSLLIEIGPRLNFSTAFSSNAVSICNSIGLEKVTRLEVSTRYLIHWEQDGLAISPAVEEELAGLLHDRMTQCRYMNPIDSFELGVNPEEWYEVDVLSEGRKALEDVNSHLGLAFDEWDLDFYTDLFKNKLGRNPTSVECFDLAQSNSEHSRHWFFKGKMVIDGKEQPESLIDMIIKTQETTNPNNVIKFSDNSSAMEGFDVNHIRPTDSKEASSFKKVKSKSHLIFTAETHNFPTGVAPFSGATTGTGGRIRDVHAVGRGGHCIAGTAGYSVGNLLIPDYELPWEDPTFHYPNNFAPPLEVLIEASNGASDYGNKFGEPVISGFARSFGLLEPSGDRREWIKPIMFSGGVGSLDANMVDKLKPEKGMEVVKLGGPVYRIGVGGGSASSVEVQGDNKSELDFGAVQRGDAEMEQKLNRVIRACLERGSENPICSIHDQGAGGNGNVLKEIVEPVGAVIFKNKFQLGDPTITTLELWGAEYQENDAILCRSEDVSLLQKIGQRERCPINFVGTVLDNGKVILSEEEDINVSKYLDGSYENEDTNHPVNLELELVLGKMPQKSVSLPSDLTVKLALERVLRLPSVASKRYLTNKVDRCVTGLIAQQQCVGPLHTPLADVAVTALSHFSPEGIATAIGEQPIKGLVDPAAGARMAVAEALTNLVFARISDIQDVKCSGNWMWAAKLPGEGAALYDACRAMCKVMTELGIALVTPDLKGPARGQAGLLLLVDLSGGKNRLGGTAIAQCFKQLGDDVPDLDDPALFKQAFIATQKLIRASKVMAGHDISDGGLITCLLEMAFAGISGMEVNITHKEGKAVDILFNEELGWVLEVDAKDLDFINTTFKAHNVPVYLIGKSTSLGIQSLVTISVNGNLAINSNLLTLFRTWEETSYRLERRQANPDCVKREFESLATPRVAVVREEGSNGDREMAASLFSVGFDVWDVTMQDLLDKQVTTDHFKGIIFPGGFSYADVLGSAKGWAASLLFHPSLRKQFKAFVEREDTFSLGVCNGCQLMGLLGWIGLEANDTDVKGDQLPVPDIVLDHNLSERFECRFSTVRIERTPSIMLRGMEGCVLGVWIAHGEGRFTFRNEEVFSGLEKKRCLAIKYVDDDGKPTQAYPLNPNGSPREYYL